MATQHPEISAKLQQFISEQKIFFGDIKNMECFVKLHRNHRF